MEQKEGNKNMTFLKERMIKKQFIAKSKKESKAS